MQKMTMTIPKHHNNGIVLSENRLRAIESRLLELYGGYSRYEITGAWQDKSGVVYHDSSFRYEILVNDVVGPYEDLQAFAKHLCPILDQKSILTTCENTTAHFVKPVNPT